VWVPLTSSAVASDPATPAYSPRSITDTRFAWPTAGEFVRALSLQDYNTRVVVIGTTLLGVAAGIVGTFAYLRKRAMLGDALSHATLPGIALAFLLTAQKQLWILLLGATITGILGVVVVLGMRAIPRIKEDAAIGIVLSVFFGAGMVLMSLVQQMRTGDEAGLQSFIYGQAAAMLVRDAVVIGASAAAVTLGCALLFKEFRLICFDKAYAGAQGWPVVWIDLLMLGLVVLITVVGLQAVGLILVVALLIIPATAARFWTDRLTVMVALAAIFGGLSCYLGATLSALTPRMPTGAVIVVVTGIAFLASMFLAPHRGIVAGLARRVALARRVVNQHLLRALAEFEELRGLDTPVGLDELLRVRTWSTARLKRLIRGAVHRSLLVGEPEGKVRLTSAGRIEARRMLRNHRLWEMYLIKYADIAPSHVDRDADEVEHVLPPDLVQELEEAMAKEGRIPPSPHPLEVLA
jgi:manganese/zinc/iron transport system permease protein